MLGLEALLSDTSCPYADGVSTCDGGRIVGPIDSTKLSAVASELAAFSRSFELDGYRAFSVEFKIGDDALQLSRVASVFNFIIRQIAENDPLRADCIGSLVEKMGWQFEFNGVRMFVAVFAPCYPLEHSRNLQTDDSILLLFQPERAFDLCGISQSTASKKKSVRNLFASCGRSYDEALIDRRIEAHLYVKPVMRGDPIVRWWDSSEEVMV